MGTATDGHGDPTQVEDQRLFRRLTVEQTGGEQTRHEGLRLGTNDDDLAAEAVQVVDQVFGEAPVQNHTLSDLQACEGGLSLGYLDADGRFVETTFKLGGAAAAIAEVADVVRP
ncbi:hypothetical protein CCR82_00110 [Halochromatium salexigens]|uniref:Uncharacterized protein n=1 Tax=Halochromatium salexigens TaxID=49447 RepID=A0AAJ0XDZ7_HALSE|nr:hypothetical protein [Halochromatium salexigens]